MHSGEIKAAPDQGYDAEAHRVDFVFFCLTKATRSLEAADVLITNKLPEDAIIIARAVYECYLHLAFIKLHEERIDDFVAHKVWAYANIESHPKSKAGKPIYDKILIPETGETKPVGLPLTDLSKATGNEIDEKIHPIFYSLLSEFAHVHMIAGSAYWNSAAHRYTFRSTGQNVFQALIWTLYAGWLLVDSLVEIDRIEEAHRAEAAGFSRAIGGLLVEEIEFLEFDRGIASLKDLMLQRLVRSS